MSLRFILNGSAVEVNVVDPQRSLLQWLRETGRTGTKEGCAEGECGACAVALLRQGPTGAATFEAVNSCLLPLPAIDGRTVVTVEGVAPGGQAGARPGAGCEAIARPGAGGPLDGLHPVQRAMVERGGSQCGYCTPGFVVSLFCEYYRPDREGFDPESIAGNLCRCTGYRPIVDVARSLPSPKEDDERLVQLHRKPEPLASVRHHGPQQSFFRPASLAEALRILTEVPGTTVLGGGTDLMVHANQRQARFGPLLSLEGVPELRQLRVDPDAIVIGGALPLDHLDHALRTKALSLPLLEQLLPLFSSRLIRRQATLGGNLATASPIGDSAPALLALDAELTLTSERGERRVPLHAFFVDYRKTVLASDELIAEVRLPLPLAGVQRFYKVSKRVHDDISTVSAAFALEVDEGGRIARIRAGFGGVANTPRRAEAFERAAHGMPWSPESVPQLRAPLSTTFEPLTDHRGSHAYRRAMIGKLFERFAFETMAGGPGREVAS